MSGTVAESARPSTESDDAAALSAAERAIELGEAQWRSEDHVRESRLRSALAYYDEALGYLSCANVPATVDANVEDDGFALRRTVMTQRASALRALAARASAAPISTRQRQILRRALSLALLTALFGLSTGAWFAYDASELGNIARGKRWTTSSAAEGMPREGVLRRFNRHFFFHTEAEQSPWIEIDLERPIRISSARIFNRDDCCGERAVPLVLEVSVDHEHWSEVAKRVKVFDSWRAGFPSVEARWVRLRLQKAAPLHLKKILIRS